MALNFNNTTTSTKMYSIIIDSHEFKLNEEDAQKVVDLCIQLSGTPTMKRGYQASTPKRSRSKFDATSISDEDAKKYDFPVTLILKDANTVQLDTYINKKDVWKLLSEKATMLGGTYNKEAKAFIFTNKANAKKFAATKVVEGKSRVALWKSFNKEGE